MKVTRVINRTEGSSEVVPALEQEWSELQRLDWKRSLVLHDAGMWDDRIRVRESEGLFDLFLGRSVWGPLTYQQAWDFLNGISAGLELAEQRG